MINESFEQFIEVYSLSFKNKFTDFAFHFKDSSWKIIAQDNPLKKYEKKVNRPIIITFAFFLFGISNQRFVCSFPIILDFASSSIHLFPSNSLPEQNFIDFSQKFPYQSSFQILYFFFIYFALIAILFLICLDYISITFYLLFITYIILLTLNFKNYHSFSPQPLLFQPTLNSL